MNNQKNYKKWLLYGGIFIAIAVIALIVFLFYSSKEKQNQQAQKNTGQPAAENNTNKTGEKAVIENKLKENKIDENALKQMAASFAERLGSFSNQSNYGNISDLKIFMTDKMRAWADDYVVAQKEKKGDTATYFGVTTKALSSQTVSFNDAGGKAEITVKTQKREISGDNNAAVSYQDIVVKFIKEKAIWKVDSAEWVK